MKKKFIIFFFILVISDVTKLNAVINKQKICSNNSDTYYNLKIKSIEVKVDKFKKWTVNGIRIITGNFRWVPEKYKKRFNAEIIVNYNNSIQCKFNARIRHNGNQKDHIRLFDNSNSIIQSIDVNLNEGQILGIKQFKLLLDNTRGVLKDEIFLTTLLRELDYLAPRTFHTNVKINNSNIKMIFQEKASFEMLKFNKRMDGPIFRGDERFFFTLVESLPDNNISNDAQGMIPLLNKGAKLMLAKQHNEQIIKKNNLNNKTSFKAQSNLNLIYLFYSNMFNKNKNNFNYMDYTLNNKLLAFYQPDKELKLDVYNLLLNSANATHALGVNNRKFYWNEKQKYFEPVNYDNNAYIQNSPSKIIFPLSENINESFDILEKLLENVDINLLDKKINRMGPVINIKQIENKLLLLKRNLKSLMEIYKNHKKEVINFNYNVKIEKKMWNNYLKALSEINSSIFLVTLKENQFHTCDIKLNCKLTEFDESQIMDLLSGKLVINDKDYQFIGSEFYKTELVN